MATGRGIAMTRTEFDILSSTSEGAAKISLMMRRYADKKSANLRDIQVRFVGGEHQFYIRATPFPANND